MQKLPVSSFTNQPTQSVQPAGRSSINWAPLQGCGSFCLHRCMGRGSSSSASSADPQRCGPREGRVEEVGRRTSWFPAATSTKLVQTAPSAPPLMCAVMCTQSARSQAGNVAVLGYFTKRSAIYELLKSAQVLK